MTGHDRRNAHARNLFQFIAFQAGVAKRAWEAEDPGSVSEDLVELLALQISKLGWLADMGSKVLGGCQSYGSAEHWLLPEGAVNANRRPAMREATNDRRSLFEVAAGVDIETALQQASDFLDQLRTQLTIVIEDTMRHPELQNVAFSAEHLRSSAKTLIDKALSDASVERKREAAR